MSKAKKLKGEKQEDNYRTFYRVLDKNKYPELYSILDDMSFKAKNLKNTTLYHTRQVNSYRYKIKNSIRISDNEYETVAYINDNLDVSEKRINKKRDKKKNEIKAQLSVENREPTEKELKELNTVTNYTRVLPWNASMNYERLNAVYVESDQTDYRSLPAWTSQQVMKTVFDSWAGFYNSISEYNTNPSKYNGRPNMPGYLEKNGRAEFKIYGRQAILTNFKDVKNKSKRYVGDIRITFPKIDGIRHEFVFDNQVLPSDYDYKYLLITPYKDTYKINIVVSKKLEKGFNMDYKPERVLGIDPGGRNFCTITNNFKEPPRIISANRLREINNHYVMEYSKYESLLMQGMRVSKGDKITPTKRMYNISRNRDNAITDFLHKASTGLVRYAKENNVDTIIIGHNKGQKLNISLGNKTNREFVMLPFKRFNDMVIYKAKSEGIHVIITEESYTSKASYLDRDELPVYDINKPNYYKFSGKRVKRGLYKDSKGRLLNADVNGSANIIRKVLGDTNLEGLDTCVKLNPMKLNVFPREYKKAKNIKAGGSFLS